MDDGMGGSWTVARRFAGSWNGKAMHQQQLNAMHAHPLANM